MPIAGSVSLMLTVNGITESALSEQPRPWNSYGAFMSSSELVCGYNNLFDLRRDVFPLYPFDWNFVDYRSVMVYNTSFSEAVSVALWFVDILSPPGVIEMGFDPMGPRAWYQRASEGIAHRYEPPAGVTFSLPITPETALVVPVLYPQQIACLWFRRYVPPGEHPTEFDGSSLAARVAGVA